MTKSIKRDYLKIEAKRRACAIEKCGPKYLNYCLRQDTPTPREQRAIDTFNSIYHRLQEK
ncbi:MAG TPA: hypothetical protein PLS00_07605 [Niabella sp.]|nr:hypothetical protein [Niabella sp.]